jgi:hypothetical protein
MAFTVPPPKRKTRSKTRLTQRIKEMRAKSDILFEGESATSIKAVATRIAKDMGRKYYTAKEAGNVRVWRLT